SFAECGRQGVPILTSRIPLRTIPERLRLYAEGLAAGGHPERLREDVAVWRHVYVASSRAQAEDELAETLAHTRRHMLEARAAHNPDDYRVDAAVVNPFNDPRVSEDDAVRVSLETGALYGTRAQVREQAAAVRGMVGPARRSFSPDPHRSLICGCYPHIHARANDGTGMAGGGRGGG